MLARRLHKSRRSWLFFLRAEAEVVGLLAPRANGGKPSGGSVQVAPIQFLEAVVANESRCSPMAGADFTMIGPSRMHGDWSKQPRSCRRKVNYKLASSAIQN
eukprot:scaffold8102_cov277-Pinguiococcus_pyrenoidosus.AAC.5